MMHRLSDWERELIIAAEKADNTPLDDFDGLSPNQFHKLLYEDVKDQSIVGIRAFLSFNTLNQVPAFRVAEAFVQLIQREKAIKLTPLGALPKKVIVELYQHQFLLDEDIESGICKLYREQEWKAIVAIRIALELAGIVSKRAGKLELTKLGNTFATGERRQDFFERLLKTYATKYFWGYIDGYPETPVGQMGWLFTIRLLLRYGHESHPANWYAKQYEKALPQVAHDFRAQCSSMYHDMFTSCYAIRIFPRFLAWFGLVEIEIPEPSMFHIEKKLIRKTALLDQIFELKTTN